MYIDEIDNLKESELLSDTFFEQLFSVVNDFEHEKIRQQAEQKARELGMKVAFNRLYNSYKREVKKNSTKALANGEEVDLESSKITNFSCLKEDEQYFCGLWESDDKGVRMNTDKGQVVACLHPIFPLKVLRNAEEGTYKIELGFYFRGQLRTAVVDKSTIASTSKILSLADQSVLVNSVNAPFLVRYLSDIEALNTDRIAEITSTSKLGWIKDKASSNYLFIPYDGDVVFDNEQKMKQLFNSIRENGDANEWLEFVKKIRAKNQPEFILSLDAAFASPLIEICGGLPFVFDLYGGTGIGKSVILNVVSSVWGQPSEYMADAKSTPTAMEVRLNTLNSLPMCLDDLAQLSQTEDDFGKLIYAWCSGQPKERSNTSLGLSKGGRWRNCIITNGERALSTEGMQGGAVNRIIDVEASGEVIFNGREGNETVNFVKENYGYAGHVWIEFLKSRTFEVVQNDYKKWFDYLREEVERRGLKKSDKQIMPMAFLFTAHELTTKYLFKDGLDLDLDYCLNVMKDLDEVDENKRAYEVVVSEIQANDFHFKRSKDETFEVTTQCWGFYLDDKNWLAILPNVFDKILKDYGFQPKSFRSWCKNKGKLQTQGKQYTRVFWEGGISRRYVVFKASFDDEEIEENPIEEFEFSQLANHDLTPFD